jgi:hypothetical protein
MFNARIVGLTATAAATLALVGCQMAPQPVVNRPIAPAPQMSATASVDGEWLSSDGVSLSRFNNGRFETVALDTGNRLAEGSFRMMDQSNLSIDMMSLVRNTNVQVNCLMVSQGQLNCTSGTGAQFSLSRRQSFS